MAGCRAVCQPPPPAGAALAAADRQGTRGEGESAGVAAVYAVVFSRGRAIFAARGSGGAPCGQQGLPVGVRGFEPRASCPPDKRANQAAPHPEGCRRIVSPSSLDGAGLGLLSLLWRSGGGRAGRRARASPRAAAVITRSRYSRKCSGSTSSASASRSITSFDGTGPVAVDEVVQVARPRGRSSRRGRGRSCPSRSSAARSPFRTALR